MPYNLRAGLSFCIIERRCFFIDVDRNRYFALPDRLNHAFLRLQSGAGDAADVRDLARIGVLQDGPATDRMRPCAYMAPSASVDSAGARSWSNLGPVTAAYLRAAHTLRQGSLANVTRRLEMARSRAPSGPVSTAMDEIASATASAKRLIGHYDLCLRWSLATALVLIRSGIGAKIIFGVCPGPFIAHCWVQVDDRIVGDDLERVDMFTPILVL